MSETQPRQTSTESQSYSAAPAGSSGSCGTIQVDNGSANDKDGVEHQVEDPSVVMSFRPQRSRNIRLGSSIESNQSNQSNRSANQLALKVHDSTEEVFMPRFGDSPNESNASGSDASARGVGPDVKTPRSSTSFSKGEKSGMGSKQKFAGMSMKIRAQNRFKRRADTIDTGSESENEDSPQKQPTTSSGTPKGKMKKRAENKSTHVFTQCSHETGQRQLRRHHRNQRIFKLIVILVSIYISCWCPYSIIACVDSLLQLHVPGYLFDFSVWILYFNSCLNPILYVWRNRAFRTAFVNLYKMRPNTGRFPIIR